MVYEFTADGQGYVFGRDSDSCDIVIWSALNDPSLSRTAGRIWLMEGELWLRNLSLHHDLLIQVPGMPPEPYLPPRRQPAEPGPARSLPPDSCVLLGPGGCELIVHQALVYGSEHRAGLASSGSDEETIRLPPLPEHLHGVAAALCAPLLAGSRLPATYADIATELQISSHKRVRKLVADLCRLYAEAVPELAEHTRTRLAREESLMSAYARHEARLVAGVWRFEEKHTDAATDTVTDPEADDRRRALMLPDYYEVAHLLVRRGVVRAQA